MKISGSSFLKEIRFTTDTARREDGGASERSFPFAAGELVHGEVTGMTPEGKVLLTIGGVTIEAKSEVALKVGGEFWFEVRQAGTEPWLALAETKGAVQEVVRQLPSGASALGRLLPTLVAMLGQNETDAKTREHRAAAVAKKRFGQVRVNTQFLQIFSQ